MSNASTFTDFATVWSILSSALILSMAVGMFCLRPKKPDAWEEWIARIAAENVETSRIAQLRALSAAPDFVEEEIERGRAA